LLLLLSVAAWLTLIASLALAALRRGLNGVRVRIDGKSEEATLFVEPAPHASTTALGSHAAAVRTLDDLQRDVGPRGLPTERTGAQLRRSGEDVAERDASHSQMRVDNTSSPEISGSVTERGPIPVEPPLPASDSTDQLRNSAQRATEEEIRISSEELRRRTEQNRAELASEIESLRAMARDMRESTRSFLFGARDALEAEPQTKRGPTHTDDRQSGRRGPRPSPTHDYPSDERSP
jgi:hypothetical protein